MARHWPSRSPCSEREAVPLPRQSEQPCNDALRTPVCFERGRFGQDLLGIRLRLLKPTVLIYVYVWLHVDVDMACVIPFYACIPRWESSCTYTCLHRGCVVLKQTDVCINMCCLEGCSYSVPGWRTWFVNVLLVRCSITLQMHRGLATYTDYKRRQRSGSPFFGQDAGNLIGRLHWIDDGARRKSHFFSQCR